MEINTASEYYSGKVPEQNNLGRNAIHILILPLLFILSVLWIPVKSCHSILAQ